jgi:hypothetical protein
VSTAVTTIKPHLAAIECPDLLRALPGWLVWRYEQHDGEARPRKVPYYTAGGKRWGVHGRPEDRQQLTTFDAAKAAAARRGFDGVGFCPMPEWGITALDFDACVIAGGVDPAVERIVAGTYAEFSPSGNGVRAFVRGALVGNRKSNRGQLIGFETFHSSGFVTYTGNRLPITELTDAANTVAEPGVELLALCDTRFGTTEAPSEPANPSDTPPLGLTLGQLRDALDVLPRDFHYDDWFMVGCALHHETSGSEDGFALWDEWSATSGKYGGADYGRSKWDSMGRGNRRPTTAHRLVRMANEHGAHIDIAQLEADDFDVVAPVPSAPKAQRFLPVQAGQFAAGAHPGWLVKNVIPAADLIVLFGESGSGKSFMALDIAGAIARGVPWRGQRAKQGRVIIVAAEGGAGYRGRLKAYAGLHGMDLAALDIWVIHAQPNMLLKDDALDVCKGILAIGGASLVIIDTFAQVMPGANENAAEDMGKALAHCRGICVATKAPVLLVHHSGKDASRGARGWSGLKAAADAELEVSRLPTGRMLRLSKQKDGEDGLAWGFDLDQVPVGLDEDGDVITSMVVREAQLPAVQQVGSAMKDLGPVGRAVVEAVNEMAVAQTSGLEVTAIVEAAAKRMPEPESSKRDTRKQRAKRALLALCEGETAPYFLEDGCISIV